MLEEINKSIADLEKTNADIKKTLFELIRCLFKNEIKKYTIKNYTLTIEKVSLCSINGSFFDHRCFLNKKTQSKKLFIKEKYKTIFEIYFSIDREKIIYYYFKNAIDIEEIEDIINFFELFNENISDKMTYIINHKEEMEAFKELLKSS